MGPYVRSRRDTRCSTSPSVDGATATVNLGGAVTARTAATTLEQFVRAVGLDAHRPAREPVGHPVGRARDRRPARGPRSRRPAPATVTWVCFQTQSAYECYNPYASSRRPASTTSTAASCGPDAALKPGRCRNPSARWSRSSAAAASSTVRAATPRFVLAPIGAPAARRSPGSWGRRPWPPCRQTVSTWPSSRPGGARFTSGRCRERRPRSRTLPG